MQSFCGRKRNVRVDNNRKITSFSVMREAYNLLCLGVLLWERLLIGACH